MAIGEVCEANGVGDLVALEVAVDTPDPGEGSAVSPAEGVVGWIGVAVGEVRVGEPVGVAVGGSKVAVDGLDVGVRVGTVWRRTPCSGVAQPVRANAPRRIAPAMSSARPT